MQAPVVGSSYTLTAPLEARSRNMRLLEAPVYLGKYQQLAAASRTGATQGYIFENGTVHVPSGYTGVWFQLEEAPIGGRRRKQIRGKKSRGKKSCRRQTRSQTRRQQSRR